MALVYNINQDALVADSFVELGITQSSAPYAVPIVSPTDFNGLVLWFKADSLSSSYSQSQGVNLWYNSAPNSNYTASQSTSSNMPIFTTGSMSGSTLGAKACSVYFDGDDGMDFTQVAAGTAWTLQILFRGNGTDSMLSGIPLTSNHQVRRFQSGTNTISIYADSGGEGISNTFSGSVTQSALCTWNYNDPYITFYEGDNKLNTKGYLGNDQLLSSIGYARYGTTTGHIVEYVLWTSSLSQTQINSLYDNYWRQKYFYEPMYEVTPVTQSSTILLPLPPEKMSISTGSLGTALTAFGQLIENNTLSKNFLISNTGNLTTRCISETGVGNA